MLGPVQLSPVFRPRVWGGTRLERWLGADAPAARAHAQARARGPVGEAWVLADLPSTILDGKCRIAGGIHGGSALSDLLAAPPLRRCLMGRAQGLVGDDGCFPLLVKFLDAGDNLSVQVHPDAAYARRCPDAHMKSEMWLVLDAAPGAVIYRGLDPRVDRDGLRRHILNDTLIDAMVRIPVKPGDCFWLPSGICHALGGGTLVAEVQTPSDTTFRVWDWGRNDPARPLHIEPALECILLGDHQRLDQLDQPPHVPPLSGERLAITGLVRTDYFDVERWTIAPGSSTQHTATGVPLAWTLLAGSVRIPSLEATLHRGDTLVIPAETEPWEAHAGEVAAEVLVTILPAPPLLERPAGGLRLA